MLDLSAHGQDKKDNPVHNEHRPEHRDIKDTEPAADKPNGNGAGGALPELELRETANERTKLVVLLSREGCSCVAVLETFVLSERRVELGLKEKKEEVQKVDAESVGDDVPALSEDDPQEEDNEKDDGADPAVGSERRRGIEKGLIFSGELRRLCSHRGERSLLGLRDIHGVRKQGKSGGGKGKKDNVKYLRSP